jgi:CRP-like cAMP-binding protein
MADLRSTKDRAAELAAKGKLDKAAELYREVLRADPRDVSSQQKLGDVLRRLGDVPGAVAAYRAVADRYARDGLLIKAIALCKTILEVDPAHVESQGALAELYAQRAKAGGPGAPGPAAPRSAPAPRPPASATRAPEPEPEPDPVVAIPLRPQAGPPLADLVTPFSEILSVAGAARAAGVEEEIVIDEDALRVDPADVVAEEELEILPASEPADAAAAARPPPPVDVAMPRVPIFSDLSREAFLAVTAGMVLHRVGAGSVVLHEGDTGTSFFVVASGRLAVSKRDDRGEPVVLAHLGEGDFFGEMALLSGAARAASVTAEAPCELLELRAEDLREVVARHPHVATSLRRFYRQRLLASAMAVSPIFRPFTKADRRLVMERFRARYVARGEVIIREGAASDGLYVILDGAVDVLKKKAGADTTVARLREGDLFGEMSLLRKTPASATVVVSRGGTLLKLPRPAFDALVTAYPQILELVAELSDERSEALEAILSGAAQWTDEGLVLV